MSASIDTPNHRILIVDDNPAIHKDFQKILCPMEEDRGEVDSLKAELFNKAANETVKTGFELSFASQGQEALKLVKQNLVAGQPFAMAFMDVRMPPGWDGIETAAHLWKACPDLQIVICTAYSDYSWDEIHKRLDQPESFVILKKPFDNVEVQQLAHTLTKKWLLTRQAQLRLAELEQMVEERTRELRETNASLALSEERFAKAFHDSPQPSAIQRLSDRRFVDVNHSFASIAGRKREEMIGKTPADLSLWEKPSIADQWLEILSRGGTVRNQPANIRSREGGFNELLVSCSSIVFGKEPHLLLLSQDVAERIILERRLRQSQNRLDAMTVDFLQTGGKILGPNRVDEKNLGRQG